mgnify:CR=1 FL=1
MSTDLTDADIVAAGDIRKLLTGVLAVPGDRLERMVQISHECAVNQRHDPPERFADQGVTRQALRMFWHFRCNLEAAMPPEPKE